MSRRVIEVKSPGAMLRLLITVESLGWLKFHPVGGIASEAGLSRTRTFELVSLLEKYGYVRIRYSPDNFAKYFRMADETVLFTDGLVDYRFDKTLLGYSVSVSLRPVSR